QATQCWDARYPAPAPPSPRSPSVASPIGRITTFSAPILSIWTPGPDKNSGASSLGLPGSSSSWRVRKAADETSPEEPWRARIEAHAEPRIGHPKVHDEAVQRAPA